MKFENIRAAVNNYYDAKISEYAQKLDTITCGEALNSWYYKKMMTPAALTMIQNEDVGARLPEAARNKMYTKIRRDYEASRAMKLQKIKAAEDAPDLEDLHVFVEWKRSKTWSMCPRAEAVVNYDRNSQTSDRASGCGYDKRSAAIANALNAQPSVMKILYQHANAGKSFPYSVHTFAGVPSFDGGCGVGCFRAVFTECGYDWKLDLERSNEELYIMKPAQ